MRTGSRNEAVSGAERTRTGEPVRSSPWRPAGVDLARCGGTATNLYVIREGESGPFKIGLAVDPADRLKTLQQGNPRRLVLICSMPIFARSERLLHDALNHHRLASEWFAATPEVEEAVAELRELAALANDYRMEFDDFGAPDMDAVLADWSVAA